MGNALQYPPDLLLKRRPRAQIKRDAKTDRFPGEVAFELSLKLEGQTFRLPLMELDATDAARRGLDAQG